MDDQKSLKSLGITVRFFKNNTGILIILIAYSIPFASYCLVPTESELCKVAQTYMQGNCAIYHLKPR